MFSNVKAIDSAIQWVFTRCAFCPVVWVFSLLLTTVCGFERTWVDVSCTRSLKSVALLQFASVEASPLGLCCSDPLLFVTAICQFNAAEFCSLQWEKSVCLQTTNPFERLRLLLSMFFVFFFLSSLLFPPPLLYHFLLKQCASSLAWRGDRWWLQAERMVAVLIAWINVGALFSANCLSCWFVVC